MPRDEMRERFLLLKRFTQQHWNKLPIRQASFVTALVEVLTWRLANKLQVFADLMAQLDKDMDVLLTGLIAVVAIAYGISVGLAVNAVSVDFQDTENSISDSDEYSFRKSVARRVPKPTKELLATLGTFLMGCFFFYPYKAMEAGYMVNFVICFILMAYRLTSTRLDDPTNREWGLKVPTRWTKPIWKEHGSLVVPHPHFPGLHIDDWPNRQGDMLVPSANAARNIVMLERFEEMDHLHPIRLKQARLIERNR